MTIGLMKYIGLSINCDSNLYDPVFRCENRKTCCCIAVWDIDGKYLCNRCKIEYIKELYAQNELRIMPAGCEQT